jgi:hypothetical protein
VPEAICGIGATVAGMNKPAAAPAARTRGDSRANVT